MISRIARLRAKKGFTIIELIVVMAIIGILTSVVVATLSYDNKPTIGKGIAKDVFYVVQDALASSEVAYPNAMKDVTNYAGFYAETDNSGKVTSSGMMLIASGGATAAASVSSQVVFPVSFTLKHDGSDADDKLCMQNAVKNAFEKYLTSKENMAGTVVVVADKEFRVVASYWTDNSPANLTANSMISGDNVMANGYYCCAYPAHYSYSGKYMLSV